MSQAEMGRWVMLVGNFLILLFVSRIMISDGQVVQLEGMALVGVFIPVIILSIVIFAFSFGVAAMHRAIIGMATSKDQHDGFEMDERDRNILGIARRNAMIFLQTALGILLVLLIANGVLPADWEPLHPRIESRADWVFTLFLLMSLAELVRDGSAIIYYRR
ncbi:MULTISPECIES: hypothetical protein [unclassified Iodidimonas]|nr:MULTISPECIES: hypothetical protein [unclassified Iodidimonas]